MKSQDKFPVILTGLAGLIVFKLAYIFLPGLKQNLSAMGETLSSPEAAMMVLLAIFVAGAVFIFNTAPTSAGQANSMSKVLNSFLWLVLLTVIALAVMRWARMELNEFLEGLRNSL